MDISKGRPAYIICDNAACRYEPNFESAIRVIPPYGTMLFVLETHGEWAKISFASKAAWSLVSNLSSDKPPERFDIRPYLRNPSPWYETIAKSEDLNVEFGPRGGKFVRTKKGFRRYF